MTQSLLKKLFIAVSVLLVISLTLSIWSVYKLNAVRIQENNLQAGVSEADTLASIEARILSNYADIRRQLDLRLGIGQDSQYFITPDDPEVSAAVQVIAGDYSEEFFWKDYKKLYRWVMRYIEYSQDSPLPILPESVNGTLDWGRDFWRLPVETLRDRAGDCEDHAGLLTSMLLNYNQRRQPIWILGVRNFQPDPKAHVAVAIPILNNRLAIWDTSARYYTRFPQVADFGSRPLPVAVDLWLTHLKVKVPDAQVYVAFSEDFYQEFSSTEEFIDWAANYIETFNSYR